MNRLGGVSVKAAIAIVAVLVVLGGFVLALLPIGGNSVGLYPSTYPLGPAGQPGNAVNNLFGSLGNSAGASATNVYQTVTMATTAGGGYPSTTVIQQTSTTTASGTAPSDNVTGGSGTMIQFSSEITMVSSTPSALAADIVGLAYGVNGYVAYQSTMKDSANVVIRVPAASYQSVIAKIQTMGNVTGITSNSNDVTVQYIDMNATLKSLVTEQEALLRLVNQSTSVNSTLAIEAQLQQVNQQINFVQSQMLQTKRLVDYSTISVSITEETPVVKPKPLSLALSVTPRSGVSPLSVTMNAVVTGGVGGYLVNYNFGDGTSAQGQILVHTFVGSGDYNVTVDVTDYNGTYVSKWAMVHVTAPPTQLGLGDLPATAAGLFIRVVGGIVEAAAVIIPLALVAAVVLLPIRRWTRGQKTVKQSQ